MIRNIRIRVRPDVWADATRLEQTIAAENAIAPEALRALRIRHQSIDARQRQVMVQLDVDVYVNEEPPTELFHPVEYRELQTSAPQAVVVGAGPGGLFAALRLIEHGIRPIIVERGRNVTQRRRDVADISRRQQVDADSNYCFGEGGAGAFSDGKLFTRSRKRGNVQGILERLCQFGADTGILSAAHPHLGTDRLPSIIASVREQIIKSGGEVHYETRMIDLLFADTATGREVRGIVALHDGHEFAIEGHVILATGHSARDVYRLLHNRDVDIEAKGFAMGVRLEHPQHLIDQIQYHSRDGRGKWLPAAEYSFVTQSDGRGVYSFCMCPGGVIVPSATANGQVVVNGMSSSARGGKWANAAMVAELRTEDAAVLRRELSCSRSLPDADMAQLAMPDSPLSLMYVQEALEHLSWIHGGRSQMAPAQRMDDYVRGRMSGDLPRSSYAPGLTTSPLHEWLPPFIGKRLQSAFEIFGRSAHGFLTNDAILIAAETRTSSPVRIPRDREMLSHPKVRGLYPCGEGAGFAGGIVSSAMDGERAADALALQLS